MAIIETGKTNSAGHEEDCVIDRRCFLGALLLSGGAVLASCASQPPVSDPIPLFEDTKETNEAPSHDKDAVRVAFAALVSPQESFYKYQDLVRYLEDKLGRRVDVIRRQTYKEVNDLLGSGEVDFGFICSLSYVIGLDEGTLSGIAAPVIDGSSFYRSYLISRSDSGIAMLEDLKNKTFAFTDPLSYTGRLSTLKLLHEQASADETYFKEVLYTYSHDSSIHAVHLGIVEGASVDGLIFDDLVASQSDIVGNVRVIYKGPAAGMPPVVASSHVDPNLCSAFQDILVNMVNEDKGQIILSDLGYDRFEIPDNSNYETIREALVAVGPKAIDESGATLQSVR